MAAAGPPPTGELEDSTSRQATDDYYAEVTANPDTSYFLPKSVKNFREISFPVCMAYRSTCKPRICPEHQNECQCDEFLEFEFPETDGEARIDANHLNSLRDKERKIGHRRVDKAGIVSYKKKPTSELMAAIQLGIGQSVGGLSSKPERDVLMQDFGVVEVVFFPGEGSNLTPAHHYSDFRFKTYAPVAFRYFRDLFGIQPEDFMLSLCNEPLKELSNPGASGSIFYLTHDDEFIIKTVQHKEADFLQKLLPGYFLNISQNKRTLLPKFYGLYCYQCGGKNIRFTVMNNLLPSTVQLHEKYDMKGSTYKRKASKSERSKKAPTLKDLDFMEIHPECLLLEKDIYDSLVKTLQRDCRVLESFKIMDYSLLVGIYNLDQVDKDSRAMTTIENEVIESGSVVPAYGLHRAKSMRTRIGQYSTPLESIQGNTDLRDEMEEDEDVPPGGIPARNARGERILLYLGIIDILQSFRLKKRLEHTVKSMVIDGDTISVHRPSYYAQRFLQYHATRVFRKAPSALKHSPSKRRALNKSTKQTPGQSDLPEQHSIIHSNPRSSRTISFSDEQTVTSDEVGGKPPDLLPEYSKSSTKRSPRLQHDRGNTNVNGNSTQQKRSDAFSLSTYPSEDALSAGTASTASLRAIGIGSSGSGYPSSSGRGPSPPLSLSESTPTHTDFTEGTPSFTNSSPSCSSDVMDMGGVSPLEATDSPSVSHHHHHHHHRSPDLHQHHRGRMVHSGKVSSAATSSRNPTAVGPGDASTSLADGSPLHHPSPSKHYAADVTVMVIPESPPPPFEAVVAEDDEQRAPPLTTTTSSSSSLPQNLKQEISTTTSTNADDVSVVTAMVSNSTITTSTLVKKTQEMIVAMPTITKNNDDDDDVTEAPAPPAIINAAGGSIVEEAEAADEDEMTRL